MTDAAENDAREPFRDLLRAALELEPGARRVFIEQRLPEGSERDDALELLAGVEDLDGFLEEPLLAGDDVFRPPMPERIGDHVVERVLGWGSMGVVYLARQAEPERLVALKVLRLDSAEQGTVDRFRREAQLLARLAHPGIATVYEAGVADLGAGQQPWFAMEYVDGDPIGVHAKEAGLDRRARVELVVQAARAVQHAHENGVVHRDLKPENVLVRRDGSVRVVDFGVARSRDENAELLTLTATGQVIGTLAYMAPEQARGGSVDAAADQFALGAMLYELLTDRLPLPVRGQLPHEALRAVADATWTPPSRHDATLAGEIEAILGTALTPEANRRYPSVGAFADDLENWLNGRPIAARPPSRLAGASRFVRRNPVLAGSTAIALLLVGAAIAFALNAALDRRRSSDVAMLMSDRALLDDLTREVDRLWPADSRMAPRLEAWTVSAEGLADRLEKHRGRVARMLVDGGATAASVDAGDGDDWVVELSLELIESIEAFHAAGGTFESMRRRLADARALRARTIDDHREAWREAAARVRADVRFDGFDLSPVEGLVPLGPDPGSNLEEFAAYATGSVPQRDVDTGRVHARAGDAITFVLIPGGTHMVGTQTADPDGVNYAPTTNGATHFGPPVEVRLDPFLVSKFEMTQDQWFRLAGSNPSDWEIGSEFFGATIGPLHPVESVHRTVVDPILARYGMTLPTEAQWEVAARGDTRWAWLSIETADELPLYANTLLPGDNRVGRPELATDGYYTHRSVGELRPNEFGLYDVLGNVWELCRDVYKVDYHILEHREGDGLVAAIPDGDVSRRGGCAGLLPAGFHVYSRSDRLMNDGDSYTGFRPSIDLVDRDSRNSRPSPVASDD